MREEGVRNKMAKREGLTIGKTRGFLYTLSKALGDVNAVKRGAVGKRVQNRVLGKLLGRLFR